MQQSYKLFLAGGMSLDCSIEQDEPVTAEDFWAHLRSQANKETQVATLGSAIAVDRRAIIAVQKVGGA